MGEMMNFPETPEEFIEFFEFADKDEVYTNGSRLIPSFRVKQMMDHYMAKAKKTDEELKKLQTRIRIMDSQLIVSKAPLYDSNTREGFENYVRMVVAKDIAELLMKDKAVRLQQSEIIETQEYALRGRVMVILPEDNDGEWPAAPFFDKWATAKRLMNCFAGSFVGYGGDFYADRESNTSICFDVCKTELDVKCKILEWFSRAAYKTEPYRTAYKNALFHERMLAGINKFLGTNFSEDDMDLIYTYLGNAIHHERTVAFVESGYDMRILKGERDDG